MKPMSAFVSWKHKSMEVQNESKETNQETIQGDFESSGKERSQDL